MAYQPKYSRSRKPQASRKQPEPLKTPESPKPQETRKEHRKTSPLLLGLTILIVPISLALSYLLLEFMFFNAARPKAAAEAPVPDMSISQDFENHFSLQAENARDAMTALEKPEAPTEPTEATIPPYEVKYTLPDDTQVAPEPNQALFGQVSTPAEMAPILEQAAYILDGQSMYFSTETELFEGSVIHYYLDETIFAVTWKEAHDKSVYTFSEVKIGHASQLRRHLSDGAYGSGKLYLPTEMAATVNAVVATSGDFYANRPALGVMVYEGNIYRNVEDAYTETCFIDANGDMLFSHMKEIGNSTAAKEFVEKNNITFSVAFGPILVENYEVRELPNVYSVGEIKEEYARSALCQMDKLHYLVAVANWEGNQPDDPTVARFQKVIATTGCKMAYCMDGGQTATVVMNDQLINRPAKGEQRRISDILYFATAIPEGG